METTITKASIGTPAAPQEWLHTVIEHMCRDFAGRVTHQRVLDVVGEVASHYRDARVTSYLPILVSRFTRERLLPELAREN
jgi:protein-tyrosine phosphatase-like protein